MGRVVSQEPCPKCRERGADKKGNNLAIYEDGGYHCYACGYHRGARLSELTFINRGKINDNEKNLLPRDFQREVPGECWKWLLQYGLSYSYWKDFTGYSPSENRLILTVGEPIQFAQGRAFTVGDSKWRNYGDKSNCVELIGKELLGEVVLVEDLISQHKVGQVNPCLCLYGTTITDEAISVLQKMQRPIALWLDADQYGLLNKKMNRLQVLTNQPVRYIFTKQDPKSIELIAIKEILNAKH